MTEEKNATSQDSPLWEIVEKELAKQEMSANKIAVIETEKIFQKVLDEKNLPGNDIDEIIKNYKKLFTNPDKIKYARAMYDRIVNEFSFDISEDDTKEIIKGYYKAISDLESADFKNFTAQEKIGLFLQRNFPEVPQKIRRGLIALAIISLSTFLLTETESGQSVAKQLLEINNYIYFKIIPGIFVIIAVLIIIIGGLYAWQNKNKNK
jgi:hypothetical protein